MKNILIIVLVLIGNISLQHKLSRFTVEIYDYNYSMSYTLHYQVTDDSISLIRFNNLHAEKQICIFKKKLEQTQSNLIADFIKSDSFNKLKSEYKNPLIEDGDRKRIIVKSNGQEKVIEIHNVYNPEIAKLITFINHSLSKNLKIKYIKR